VELEEDRKIWWVASTNVYKPFLTRLPGLSLAARLNLAIEMQKIHCKAFDDHNKTFDDSTIAKWTKMVTDWEADQTKANPFEEPETCEYDSYDV
jgi:hypothetical protein